ncbi:MAG: PAS domain S-box protein, partial [Deltaproteobacteria bacterium]|nr:PAS domain S-box protein [Deltaproteobacteria bacterium]
MAKDKGKRFPRLNNLILGIMIGAFFWVLVSLIEILLFHQGNFIQQIFAPDRHELVYRLIVLILFTAFGGYSQYLFSFRRKAEERIQCAYSELEQIFNCSADGICLIDLDYNVLRINKTFSALLKIKQDEAVGRKCYEIFYGPLCHTLNCPLVKILKGEKMVECEMEKKRSDGPPIFNLVILTPFRGPRGDLLGIVKDCRDISEKKRAEEQLREYRFHLEELVQERTKELSVANEQLQQQNATRRQMQEHCTESEIFYRKLFEESSEAVFLTDYETDCIVKANRQAEKMLRRPIKKIIGMNQAHLFSSHEAVSYLQLVKEHLTEMVKQPILAETVTSEGNRVPVEVRSSMIELAGGKKNRQLFFRDITEQKTAEKLLQKHSSDLAQRVRELDCLYSISSLNEQPDISLIEIFQGIVNLIPFVWQYPETLCARICLNDGREFKTVNFRERVVKLSEEIRTRKNSIGMLEVMYLPDKGPSNGGPFSEDQKNLIHVIAEQVGKIIQRNQAETALRESESKLSTMLDSLGDHINMMDRDLNILWANNTAKKFFGEDIIGKKCYQVYHGRKEPCEPYPCIVLKAFMDGKIHKHETQVITKKSEVTYYYCIANVALRDNGGKPIAAIETCKDIT